MLGYNEFKKLSGEKNGPKDTTALFAIDSIIMRQSEIQSSQWSNENAAHRCQRYYRTT